MNSCRLIRVKDEPSGIVTVTLLSAEVPPPDGVFVVTVDEVPPEAAVVTVVVVGAVVTAVT